MKKFIRILIVFITFVFNINIVSASTNTYARTEEDLLINDWITVTTSNKGNIINTPAVDATEKVYDFADLFTDNEEKLLFNKVSNYIKSYKMDLAIVTIDSNNKISPSEYADDFYDYNDFGISSSRDGILFLIDMQNREIYMSTTGSAIEMYNDYRIDQALDEVYQYMSSQNYYQGTSNYIDIILGYAKDGLPKNTSYGNNGNKELPIVPALIGSLIITAIVMVILISKNKLVRKATTAEEYLVKDSVDIKVISDVLISSNTTKQKIERNTSSGGGSSTHISSSGGSHGGGGHRF